MYLASECGEILALLRWIDNGASDEYTANEANKQRIADELADVAIGVILLSDRVGVDIWEAVADKVSRNEARFPATPPNTEANVS